MKKGVLVTLSKYGWRHRPKYQYGYGDGDEYYKLRDKIGVLVEIVPLGLESWKTSSGEALLREEDDYNVLTTEGKILHYSRKDLKLYKEKS